MAWSNSLLVLHQKNIDRINISIYTRKKKHLREERRDIEADNSRWCWKEYLGIKQTLIFSASRNTLKGREKVSCLCLSEKHQSSIKLSVFFISVLILALKVHTILQRPIFKARETWRYNLWNQESLLKYKLMLVQNVF